jgi:hypothetical protein
MVKMFDKSYDENQQLLGKMFLTSCVSLYICHNKIINEWWTIFVCTYVFLLRLLKMQMLIMEFIKNA